MELRHGALRLELPEGWIDRSTLLFVAPALPTDSEDSPPTEAVSITFTAASSPQEALGRQADELRELDPSFEILASEPFEAPLGRGWSLDQRYLMNGVAVRQLAVALPVLGGLVVATAATTDERFSERKEELQAILSSLGRSGERG